MSLVVRLGAGAVMLTAGIAKVVDLPATVRATRNYEILPEWAAVAFGNALPFIEVLLGVFLILGIATRWAAFVYLALLAAFVVGTVSAWARGLTIDCGCFGGDGELAAGVKADYLGHLLDQAGFTLLGVWLAVFPKSRLSFDSYLMLDTTVK